MGIPHRSILLTYRVVLIDPGSMRILVLRGPHGPVLPQQSVPADKRTAQMLTEAMQLRFDFSTIQLAMLPSHGFDTQCVVHEIVRIREDSRRVLCFEKLENIAQSEIDEEERNLISQIIAAGGNPWGRFGRLGWINELLAMLPPGRKQSAPYSIRHLNQGIDFCLMNLRRADDAALWFKAVGEPNVHEYALTHELACRYPRFLPQIVTSVPGWNGWISKEVRGSSLDHCIGSNQWAAVVKSLADLQRSAKNDLALLRSKGARDRSCARLKTLLGPYFCEMSRAMHAQVSTRAPVIPDCELDLLGSSLESALNVLEQSGIPDTLLHLDIGHGNVIASRNGAVFLDWAEAGIGHPFLSLEHLLAAHESLHPESWKERNAYRNLYASCWRPLADLSSIKAVKKVAPAVAALCYGIDIWESAQAWTERERGWPLMRATLRRAKRELETSSEAA